MFITSAYAQAADTAATSTGSPDWVIQLLPFLAVGLIIYLMILRPQMTVQKKHLARLKELAVGEEVVFAGGMIGKISKLVDQDEVIVETENSIKFRILRSSVNLVREDEKAGKA